MATVSDIAPDEALELAVELPAEAIGLSAELPLVPPPPRPETGFWLACLATAAVIHIGVLSWLNWPVADSAIGGGGTELEAISVDLVQANAIEAVLDAAAAGATSTSTRVDQREGGERQRQEAADAPDLRQQRQPEARARTERADLVIPDAEVKPEPPVPELPSLVIAPRTSEQKVDTPEPPQEIKAPPGAAVASVASAPSEAAAAEAEGGTAARGLTVLEMATQSAAIALTGDLAAYARQVQQAVARNPPRVPRGNTTRGDVVITFALGLDGTLLNADVLTSSGSPTLDEAALTSVRQTRFPAPPAGSQPSQLVYRFPVRFR